ncbi:MAG: hypothetical protein CMP10_08505 [Zetaproteobacteria bacterium]|nr:hypothetical protein [Pseudobdellovibrionaceae bacterium]
MSQDQPQVFAEKENQGFGHISGQVYRRYLTANNHAKVWLTVITIFLFFQTFLPSAFRWLIGALLDECQTLACEERTGYQLGLWLRNMAQMDAVLLLTVIVFAGMGITGMSWFLERLYLNLGAMRLHRRMVRSFQQVSVNFFDRNPSGRLIRRFSSDYSALLNEIPEQVSSIASCVLALVWAVIMVAFEAPPVLVVCIPCALFYFRLQALYRPASRETQRLSKVLESPIWSLYSETINGFQIVRAFDRNRVFSQRLNKLFTNYGKAFFLRGRMTRWLTLRLKLVAEVFSFACTMYGIYAVSQGIIGVGTAGFLMSLAIGLDGTMQWLTRAFAELETSMVSAERILEYQDLEKEEDLSLLPAQPELSYPAHGGITFENFSMSYQKGSAAILKGLNFRIPPGKKVGIMGRTGAGKSSLFQSLFRMVHVIEGDIKIDSISINSLPVERLRSIFGIVPQEPHLFSGTIRSNLDRQQAHADADIWEALRVAGLHEFIENMEQQLDTPVLDRGENLSVGQRQLLCMARAILSDAKVILMDEATANVDGETDQLIHKAMDIAFANKTILIIAHRVSTIEDCDFIIPIDDGSTQGILPPKEAIAMAQTKPEWSGELNPN